MTTKHGSARRWFISGLAAVTVVAGLAVGPANPAAADPVTSIVGVGSDTIQDVWDQFAINLGNGLLGSYDAVNPGDHKTVHDSIAPKPGCTMTRPNGSGEGVTALRQSLGSTVTGLADPPEPGCVDFARSSSGPATPDPNGQLVYVPFALDAVATATGPATAVTGTDPAAATNIVDADQFSKAQVVSMYHDGASVTLNGHVYDPQHGAGNIPIDLYVPQSGSGTRNFWLGQMGLSTSAALPTWVHDTFTLNGNPNTIVEEHDGTVFATDPNAFGPFSIAQFIAQTNGHNDRRHHVVIHSLDGVAPLNGTTLNTAYPITREVYDVVSFARVTSTAAADAQFVSIFNSRPGMLPAAICRQSQAITNFGFAQLTGAPLGHTCGQIATDLRAFPTL